MPASSIKTRLASLTWCLLASLGVVAGYLGLGLVVVSAVGEPILGTAVLGGFVTVLVGAARVLQPQWFTHAPATRPMSEAPHFARTVLGCLILAFLAGQALALWLYDLGGSAGFDQSRQAREDAGVLPAVVLVLVAAPLSEELLLRGVLYPLLRRRAGVVASVLVTTGVFGLLHGNIVQLAATAPMAILLALVYERTRVLWPCVLIHVGFNLAAILVPAAALKGLANPVSALLTTAFLGSALALYRTTMARATHAGLTPSPLLLPGGAGAAHHSTASGCENSHEDRPRRNR